MADFWRQQGVPHKGWTLVDVSDVREDGQSEWETDYETCMRCGNEKIRYVHILEHCDVNEEFRVGCTCAEKMTIKQIFPSFRNFCKLVLLVMRSLYLAPSPEIRYKEIKMWLFSLL